MVFCCPCLHLCANARKLRLMNTPLNARRLREATRRLILAHRALDSVKRPCGTPLSIPHAYALIELLQTGPMTISALAARLNIDRTNVSRLCTRMEGADELIRMEHPHDKRARLLRLTAHGEHLARAADSSSTAHFRGLLTALGSNAEQIINAIDQLADTMTNKEIK